MSINNRKSIIISQPFFFPWIGMFEQINFADVYVHYDDVQYSKGHFQDRVQIKTDKGFKWLTVGKKSVKLGTNINKIQLDDRINWKKSHLDFLKQAFKGAPFSKDAVSLVEKVYSKEYFNLADISIASIEAVLDYYSLKDSKVILNSSALNIDGKSTKRVLSICKHFKATNYITGMGALNYFDFNMFEKENINVEFIDYARSRYPQLYGEFNPHISILDLVANIGKEGTNYFNSKLVYWKDFIKSKKAIDYLK